MGLRYRPELAIGRSIRIGKTGISLLTGIPGFNYRYNFSSEPTYVPADDIAPSVNLPGGKDAVFKVVASSLRLLVLVIINVAIWKPLGYLTPLLFLKQAYNLLFNPFTYGWKSVSIYTRDLRYRNGQRYIGSRFVKDKNEKIYFTPWQRTIARTDGMVKVILIGLALFLVATTPASFSSKPTTPLSIKNLTLGY